MAGPLSVIECGAPVVPFMGRDVSILGKSPKVPLFGLVEPSILGLVSGFHTRFIRDCPLFCHGTGFAPCLVAFFIRSRGRVGDPAPPGTWCAPAVELRDTHE